MKALIIEINAMIRRFEVILTSFSRIKFKFGFKVLFEKCNRTFSNWDLFIEECDNLRDDQRHIHEAQVPKQRHQHSYNNVRIVIPFEDQKKVWKCGS